MSSDAAKILVVVEDSSSRQQIVERLERSYQIAEARTCRQAIELLRERSFDLVLVDDSLSDGKGMRLAQRLRAQDCYEYLPIILLVCSGQEDVMEEAFRKGVTDILVQPLCLTELSARVFAALRSVERIQRLQDTVLEAQVETGRDPLTGLANRLTLEEYAVRALAKAYRQRQPVSLLIVDLDDFKELNDRHGHLAGDAALRHVAEVLLRSVRLYDLVARYGGDEFVVLLPDASHEHAARIADDLGQMIAEDPIELEGQAIAVGASIGIASETPTPGGRQELRQAFANLFQRADTHLYEVKAERKKLV